jgi:hypothetical protein
MTNAEGPRQRQRADELGAGDQSVTLWCGEGMRGRGRGRMTRRREGVQTNIGCDAAADSPPRSSCGGGLGRRGWGPRVARGGSDARELEHLFLPATIGVLTAGRRYHRCVVYYCISCSEASISDFPNPTELINLIGFVRRRGLHVPYARSRASYATNYDRSERCALPFWTR